jgi:disulfide bond formation protein DsbB
MIEQSLIKNITQTRILNVLALVAGMSAMTYAYYLQYFEYLAPCPLCIFDRVFLLGILLTLLTASIHNPGRKGQRIYASLALLCTFGGLVSGGRHVWLQHLPADQVPACGPGLNYLLDTFPLGQVMDMVFRGSGECAEVSWRFLGFTLAEVTLMMFVGYALFALFQLLRKSDEGISLEIQ